MGQDNTIRQWWDLFHSDSALTEIRILAKGKTFSGYFTDCEKAIAALASFQGGGIYSPINGIKESCYGRSQHDVILPSPKSTTTDADIARRRWILIDLDPVRPSDTNSSDGEKVAAYRKCREVFKFLRNEGFYTPIVADSGNGYHLYYRVDMDNTPENTELVKNFLGALDALMSDEAVNVDTSVYNAARIAKVIGTSSNKGANTASRPQRESRFIHVPEEIKVTPTAYVAKVAGYLPKPERPSQSNGYSSEKFDLDGFIKRHSIEVVKVAKFSGGEKIILRECPFDHNHKDAAILRLDNGAIAFKCFHNSCSQYTWKDFRIHYEPDAYTRRERDEYRHKRNYYGKQNPQPVEPLQEDTRGKMLLEMSDIKWVDPSDIIHIPTGLEQIDTRIIGFGLGEVTIVSGLSGAGKTTILDTFALSAVQRGYKVAMWSGELSDYRFQSWLDQMAAGRAYVKKKAGYENLYYCPKMTAEKIHGWLKGNLRLFNNDYGTEWSTIRQIMDKAISEGVQLIMLDNLMAIDMESPSDNDAQTSLIKELKNVAKTRNIHIILVCHPRKEQSFQLLRKESIAGTANLTNLCDNLLIIHRVSRDFEKRATEFWGKENVAECMKYNVILEIAKNRSMGVVDDLTGLYYEPETRRVLNRPDENIVYGWNEEVTPAPLFTEEDKPKSNGDIPDDAWDAEKEKEIQRWWDK